MQTVLAKYVEDVLIAGKEWYPKIGWGLNDTMRDANNLMIQIRVPVAGKSMVMFRNISAWTIPTASPVDIADELAQKLAEHVYWYLLSNASNDNTRSTGWIEALPAQRRSL